MTDCPILMREDAKFVSKSVFLFGLLFHQILCVNNVNLVHSETTGASSYLNLSPFDMQHQIYDLPQLAQFFWRI